MSASNESGWTVDWPGADQDTRDAKDRELACRLAERDGPCDDGGCWSESLWRVVVEGGANRWAIPVELGGAACDRPTLVRRYGRLAEGSLTAAFLLSQHDAAVRRLALQAERAEIRDWLTRIADGSAFTTVGISQLTTSRRHGASPLVATERPDGGFRLDGVMPWVTGAERADLIVAGAALEDGRQVMVAMPTKTAGVRVEPAFELAALQASCTAEVRCDGVEIEPSGVLAGPVENVMAAAPGMAGTGGLETSALALGQARVAILALRDALPWREEAASALESLGDQWLTVAAQLQVTAAGLLGGPSAGEVRRRANALVLAATQSYLTARKGSGFLKSDPAQRWARQALFFLVWSCPGPVAQGALHDLAGMCEL